MPLTPEKVAFLAAYAFESTSLKAGPAVGDPDPEFHFEQVKEKWGRLRVHTTPTENPQLLTPIESARRDSEAVCEACGAPGTLGSCPTGRLRTPCGRCRSGGAPP